MFSKKSILFDGLTEPILRPLFGSSGASFVSGAVLDLRFDVGRYLLNGQRLSLSSIDSYHSRTSSRWAERADGSWQEFATGSAAILPGRGYDAREGRTILNFNPLNPRLWQVGGAGVFTDLPGNFLGFSSATTFTGLGQSFHRARTSIGEGALMPGEVYAVRALYRAGTSPRARVHVRCASPAVDAKVDGLLGSLTVTANFAGPISQVENIYWGSGLYECRFLYTCTVTGGTGWSLAIGPDSDVSGNTIGIVAGQITRTAWHVPWGSGAVAADNLVIPAAEAGITVSPASTGLTMFWRGQDFPSVATYPKALDIRIDNNNRMSFERRTSNGQMFVTFANAGSFSSSAEPLVSTPYGKEYSIVASWRPDGTTWVKIGADNAAQLIAGRPILSSTPTVIGIGNAASGADRLNSITRRCGLLPYSVSDGDALALFNQINEGLR